MSQVIAARIESLGNTEVGEEDATIGGQQDVRRLDIAMYQSGTVGFIERVHASEFPLRIESIRVTSRSENDDSLTLQMTVSTINEAAAPGSVAMRTGASR
jgi:hypothetical protein